MIKRKSCKSLAILLSICFSLGLVLPTNLNTVQATETTVNQQVSNTVSVSKNNDSYSFGNDLIKRSFSTKNGVLKTENITNYRTNGNTVFTPNSGSEEFIINTLDNGNKEGSAILPTQKLINDNWTIESDSIATNEGENGPASKMFDGDNITYYHSNYVDATEEEHNFPHNIYVDLKESKNIKSIRYQQRVDSNGNPTVSGHVKEFKIYIANSMEELKNATTPVFTGEFKDIKENYINLNDDGVNTQFIRIEFVNGYITDDPEVNKNVACCSEFDFFEDKVSNFDKTIKSSYLKLAGEPVEADIEDEETGKSGKTLTFNFNPVTVQGVEYTISEVITMYDGESFMRKHLEISVPEEQAANAKIDYIDLENMNINESDLQKDQYWTIPEQSNNSWMANMKGDYLELGQPYYLAAMYFGCEFPQTENKIRNNNGFIRYHYGKSLAKDAHFEYNDNNVAGKMTTWPAVVGAARSKDYSVVQSDFYEYIETIATKTDFRKQYNSWFDHMKDISAENIQESFYEVEKGFTQNGVEPLDSYVVDDGWINYNSFWDFNSKFPNQLYDSSLQVEQLGSNFGLWLGPRGGYGTETTIAKWISNNNLGSVNYQSGGDINISDARYLNKLTTDIFLDYQDKFNVNYWKLDGMLLNPSTDKSDYYVTGKPEYTITETYERWTDMYEDMREQGAGEDLWINMTSYVNPSPWYLQWVNSVWMQNTADVDFTNKFNSTDEQQMLTYRDNSYYEFVNERQWQLPFKYFYNHDPVYGNRTHEGKSRNPISFTDDELREYLYMLGTRGTAFWEYYYSYNMFDDDKWQVNAEATKWIEENFDILQKSKMIGGKPNDGEIYGYSCWTENEGIVSLRNPSDVEKTITVKFDNLVGVYEGTDNLYGKVVIGDIDKYQKDEIMKYGKEITYTLQPKETLIMQYGEKDTEAAKIDSLHANGKVLEVEFNETIRTPDKNNITVEGNVVESATLSEDLRTIKVTLQNEIEDTKNFTVIVDGIKDVSGNVTKETVTDDYYKDDIVTSIVNEELRGNSINKGNVYSIDGKEDFSVAGIITTSSKNAEIVRQEGSYLVSIDDEGYLNFSLNDVTVNSKYTEKTIVNGEVKEEIKGLIADGKEHQFAAVKEVNGMLKLYIDGKLVASQFDETKANPNITKNNVIFGDKLTGSIDYITILDKALAFDDVKDLAPSYENIVAKSNNSKVKVTAYDVTEGKAVAEKSDRPFSHLNDGNKDYLSNYMELNDTADGKGHSRYVQIDLGEKYEIDKLHMTRYADGRTYGPTVIALSNTENFNDQIIVYNSDKEGTIHNLGEGINDLYQETAEGKEFKLNIPVKARYIRIYMNGNTDGATSDHIVEFEAYAKNNIKLDSLYRKQ